MAFTGSPTGSLQYNLQNGVTQGGADAVDVRGTLRAGRFSYTHAAGAGTGEVNLIDIPAGNVVVYPRLSGVITSAFATSADLNIGHRAYINPSGTVVPADEDHFLNDFDAATGGYTEFLLPAVNFSEFLVASASPASLGNRLTIYALIDAGNIEDTDTINGWVVWGEMGG